MKDKLQQKDAWDQLNTTMTYWDFISLAKYAEKQKPNPIGGKIYSNQMGELTVKPY